MTYDDDYDGEDIPSKVIDYWFENLHTASTHVEFSDICANLVFLAKDME